MFKLSKLPQLFDVFLRHWVLAREGGNIWLFPGKGGPSALVGAAIKVVEQHFGFAAPTI